MRIAGHTSGLALLIQGKKHELLKQVPRLKIRLGSRSVTRGLRFGTSRVRNENSEICIPTRSLQSALVLQAKNLSYETGLRSTRTLLLPKMPLDSGLGPS